MGFWQKRRPAVPARPDLPADLDLYLSAREAAVLGIRKGLGKQIVWADPLRKTRTRVSIIYVHGFSASSGELRPVPDRVAQHLTANLFFARLAGHAVDGDALGAVTIGEWCADLVEAIAIGERLGERVVVMATSTGAALATWALAQPDLAGKVAAAVLFSPNYRLRARGASLLSGPFARQLVRLILGPTRSFVPVNAEHARVWTSSYSTAALLTLAQAMKLANRVRVETIRTPALFLLSQTDKVVDPARTEEVAARWGGPHRLLEIEKPDDPMAHVIAGDILSPSTTDLAVREICTWLDATLI